MSELVLVGKVRRALGLDAALWTRLDPAPLGFATALAVGASLLLAFNRFGGLIVDAPRAFVRMTLIGIYGWLGLAVFVWLLVTWLPAAIAQSDQPGQAAKTAVPFHHTLASFGFAHAPILALGLVLFVAAGLFQILGPGLVVAVFALGFWFPALLVMAIRHPHQLTIQRALAVVAVPYLFWLALIARHLLGQIQHLL